MIASTSPRAARLVCALVAASVIGTACTTPDAPQATESTTVAPTAPPSSPLPTTDAVPTTSLAPPTSTVAAPTVPIATDAEDVLERPVREWTAVEPGGECGCADGSDFVFWDRPDDPTRVVLFLQGGGACFDATTCQFQGGTYTPSVGPSPDLFGGVFDLDAPDNPIAGRSIVYVPYCTGDVHLGSVERDYGWLTVRHLGHTNVTAALDHLQASYPDASEIFVTGISAGAIPSPFYAAHLRDRFPDASITVLADGSGGYRRTLSIAAGVGSTWGSDTILPDWPSARGLPLSAWSIPGLFVRAAAHAPDIRFARFDYAYDGVQVFFRGLAGDAPDDLLADIDDNDAWIAAEADVEVATYTAAGDRHTVLLSPALYALETAGVRLVDWISALLAGDPVDDVRCDVCAGP